jgi:hypothetical protein
MCSGFSTTGVSDGENQAAAVWRRDVAQDCRPIRGEWIDGAGILCAGVAREGISTKSLRRWQLRLGGESDQALIAKATRLTSKPAGFIDLGDLRSGASRYEVRLELGAGVILSIARG